jgi:4-amino-4-deoxy-L-arabinose transferase-like glycosyltransferase
MRTARFALVVAGPVAVAAAIRVAYVVIVGRHIVGGLDSIAYDLVGGSIANGHGYSNPVLLFQGVTKPTANFPPLFPLTIALLDKLGLAHWSTLQMLGALTGAITTGLTAVLARRLTGSHRVAFVAAALVAISPALIASDSSVMSETIAIPLVAGMLVMASLAATSSSMWVWTGLGVLAGLAALAHSQMLVLLVTVVPAVALCLPATARIRLVRVAVALGAAVLVMLPWTVRNVVEFNPPIVLSTNGDKTLAGANCDSVYRGTMVGLWDQRCLDEQREASLGEARFDRALRSEGLHYIAQHKGRLPEVVVIRVLRSWGLYHPTQQVAVESIESRDPRWQRVAWASSIVLYVLALPALFRRRRDRGALVLLAGPAAAATLVIAATYGNQRFLLLAIPGLSIAAADTVVHLWDKFHARPPAIDASSASEPAPATAEAGASRVAVATSAPPSGGDTPEV